MTSWNRMNGLTIEGIIEDMTHSDETLADKAKRTFEHLRAKASRIDRKAAMHKLLAVLRTIVCFCVEMLGLITVYVVAVLYFQSTIIALMCYAIALWSIASRKL